MSLILILDDRITNRNIFSRLALSLGEGITVQAFNKPETALAWLDDNSPDLVITDYKMPGLDGAEFTRQLRAKAHGADVPVIVITAYDDRTFRLRALEAGATDFLNSPVDHYEFITRARNLLKLHRQQQFIKSRAQMLEQQLRRSQQSNDELVRNSREALAQVIDTVPAMISATDKDGCAVFVNAHFAILVGYPPEALLGEKLGDILRSDQSKHSAQLDKLVFGTAAAVPTFEEEVVDHSGARRILLTTKAPLRDQSNNVVSVLTTSVDITERKEAEGLLRHMALHDTLTDLPNRTMLSERIQHELSRGSSRFALHLIDLDRFKIVNDAFGHASGDRLLQKVTARLNEYASSTTMVARLAGDEFVILQMEIADPSEAGLLAQNIIDTLSTPFICEDQEITIGSSIGIALCPCDAADSDRLLKCADLAMYNAKAEGRNTFRFFSAHMDASTQRSIILETDLRKALGREQLLLHYQPQIDLATGRIVGAEALLRWQRPTVGLTSPAAFLDIAEDSGLIVEIGEWVLREACAQGAVWQQLGLPAMRVAVNLSPVQLRRPDLVSIVAEALEAAGFDPALLDLELTETGLLGNTEQALATLQGLKELGVQLSVDDFGTGYSSLNYVKNFPVDRLKLDRSFVSNLTIGNRDAAIVDAITNLARSLNIRVVAEGVETQQQLLHLLDNHCDEAQGFYFSRPLPPADFEALLRERPAFRLPAREKARGAASAKS
ncbi:EAL domain-containing response regulator [Microvirga sp. 2TAF3]|uniref:EAL domain-containing response regulator n=1 Tax=Microvirga sp. 2TAF3 TaxID=3233014 RepID=UPI003F955AC2